MILALQRGLVSALALLTLTQCKPAPQSTTPSDQPEAHTEAASPPQDHPATLIGVSFDQRRQELRNVQFEILDRVIKSRPKTRWIHGNADYDADLQITHVKQILESGVNFLIVFPMDPERLYPLLSQAESSGVEVIVMAPPPKESPPSGVSFVHTSPYHIGQIAGKLVGEALIQKHQQDGPEAAWGKVVQLRGDEARESSQRAQGFRDALHALVPQALVHDAPTEWNPELVPQRLNEAYRIHPKFDVIYAHDDLLANAAHQWVRSSENKLRRNQLLICGTDAYPGENSGQAFLQRGLIEYSIFHPPLVDVAWEQILGKLNGTSNTLEGVKEAVPFAITPQNLDNLLEVGFPAARLK